MDAHWLHERFFYEDGQLIYKHAQAGLFNTSASQILWNHKAGTKLGKLAPSGYILANLKSKSWGVHRLIWLYHKNKLPEHNIDHIDRNPSNNKIENLRDVTHQINMLNRCNNIHSNLRDVNPMKQNLRKTKTAAKRILLTEATINLILWRIEQGTTQPTAITLTVGDKSVTTVAKLLDYYREMERALDNNDTVLAIAIRDSIFPYWILNEESQPKDAVYYGQFPYGNWNEVVA